MKYLKTLRVRFALWTAGWLLLVLMLLGTFIYVSFARAQAQSIDDALRLTAAQILLNVDDETLRLENGDEVANSTLREQFSLQIVDLGGETRQRYGPYQDLPPQPIVAATSGQSGAFNTFIDPPTQHPVRVYAIPIAEDEGVLGTLQVAHSLVFNRPSTNCLPPC
jgi:hypothetical protein